MWPVGNLFLETGNFGLYETLFLPSPRGIISFYLTVRLLECLLIEVTLLVRLRSAYVASRVA